MTKPCRRCGKSDRFVSGPCRPCSLAASRIHYQANRERYLVRSRQYNAAHKVERSTKQRQYARKIREQDPKRAMLLAAKERARRRGIPFDLSVDDFDMPEICPVLGLIMRPNLGKAAAESPSLDRVVPTLGYVKGNVRVISYRANMLKNDATPHELRLVADYAASLLPPVLP